MKHALVAPYCSLATTDTGENYVWPPIQTGFHAFDAIAIRANLPGGDDALVVTEDVDERLSVHGFVLSDFSPMTGCPWKGRYLEGVQLRKPSPAQVSLREELGARRHSTVV